jgi:hypothetical protein
MPTKPPTERTILVLGEALQDFERKLRDGDFYVQDDIVRNRLVREWLAIIEAMAKTHACTEAGWKIKANALISYSLLSNDSHSPQFVKLALSLANDLLGDVQ